MARPCGHRCCGVCVQFFGIYASRLAYRYRQNVWNQRGYDGYAGFGVCVGGNAAFRAVDDHCDALRFSQAAPGGYCGVSYWAGAYIAVDELLDAHGGTYGGCLRPFGILGHCRAYRSASGAEKQACSCFERCRNGYGRCRYRRIAIGSSYWFGGGVAPDICHCGGNICALAGVSAYHFALGSRCGAFQRWSVAGVVSEQGFGGIVHSYRAVRMGLLHGLQLY